MSIYLLIYIIIAFLMLLISLKILKQYNKYFYGKYLFISMFSFFIWLILYIFSFTITYEKNILLILSRSLYSLFIIGLYCMLFFIVFFNSKDNNKKIHVYIIVIFSILFTIGLFTPFIIEELEYSQIKKVYIEKYGILYFIYAFIYLISPLLILISLYIKLNTINKINKIRLIYISVGFFIFCLLEWFFLVILPLFNIWILQKEQILFFIPFIIGTWYSINRYHFLDIKIGLGKIFSYLLPILLSGFLTYAIYRVFYYYYSSYSGKLNLLFGKQGEYLSSADLFLYVLIGIILYILFYKLLNNIFKFDTGIKLIEARINRLKKEIPFITNINDLNYYLKKEFKKIFNIKYLETILIKQENIINIDDSSKNNNEVNDNETFKYYENKNSGFYIENNNIDNISRIYTEDNSEIYKYFNNNKLNKLFINDTVFIEENKNKFDYKKLQKEIAEESYLVFPIKNNNDELIGIFNIGIKSFKDTYTSEEINIIQDLVYFLEGHIKYLGIYNEINNLNLNLDKLVDEKTIKYNSLISKQKEFIGFISHEVKTPIANSIFQADCIINTLENGDYTNKEIIDELNILNSQLLKSGDLLNKLFDIEKHDINNCKLFIEKTNLSNLLQNEINVFEKININIKFTTYISSKIIANIDIIQFTQVIDNILTNAVKFSKSHGAIIKIENYTKGNYIYIIIKDNGVGFQKTNIQNIFDKYSTGESSSSGLGMGLYLCKKIIETHKGTIEANKSKSLGGAKFIIKLPK